MPSSRASSWPRDRTRVSYVSCNGKRVLSTSATGKPYNFSSQKFCNVSGGSFTIYTHFEPSLYT